MEENKQLTVTGGQVPAFVQEKLNSLAGALEYAHTLLKSGIAPAHFYYKGSDGKPDYTKGKPEAVVIVLQFGSEIGMSPMQALQQLVPVNNLVSLKGDGAKALIQRSGKLATWQETEIGTQGKDDWGFEIVASRKDNGEKSRVTFTVADAKRAGLWIDEAAVQRSSGLKYSPWYRHPKRMLKYRALGFIARDLFPDVLSGIYTEEEAADMNTNNQEFRNDDGLTVNLEKETKTDESNQKVVGKIAEKQERKRELAQGGNTAQRVKIEPSTEPIQEAEVIESKPAEPVQEDNTCGEETKENYFERIKKMTSKEIVNEFKSKCESGVIWFSVDQYLAAGGSKTVKDIVMLLDASNRGELDNALKVLNVNLVKPQEGAVTERDFHQMMELMDRIAEKGIEPDMLATELGFAGQELMLKTVSEDVINEALEKYSK